MTPGWRPGLVARALLTVSVVFAAYVLSPTWWGQVGEDSRVFYAVGTLVRAGGDPYDPSQLAAEEDRLYNLATHASLHPVFAHATYANPPLFSTLLALTSRLPLATFRAGAFIFLAVLGVLGTELSLAAAGWRRRGLARTLMLSSSPMVLGVFVGNTSPLLLVGCAGAWLAMTRGRPYLAGALLSLLWLKPSVGLLVAAALLAAGPGRRGAAVLAFGAASIALAGLDVVTSGLRPLELWLGALTGYAGSLSASAGRTVFSSNAQSLAGLPGLFLDRTPAPVALLASVLLAATVCWFTLHNRAGAVVRDPVSRLGVALATVLLISPYLHLNDLVLEAAPLLLIASVPLNPLSRVALTAWAAGAFINLTLLTLFAGIWHITPQSSAFGFGVVLNAATFAAALAAARVRAGTSP